LFYLSISSIIQDKITIIGSIGSDFAILNYNSFDTNDLFYDFAGSVFGTLASYSINRFFDTEKYNISLVNLKKSILEPSTISCNSYFLIFSISGILVIFINVIFFIILFLIIILYIK